jgi:membrane-associated protease RseP (regulator of RpoE activity)
MSSDSPLAQSSPGPLPSVPPADDKDDELGDKLAWRLPLVAFAATVLSTFFVGASAYVDVAFPRAGVHLAWQNRHYLSAIGLALRWLGSGASYAVPLLIILLCHEFGHYAAARWHGVGASLPIFVPFPLPPLGTFGAVIRLRTQLRQKSTILDVAAAGPLAGLCAAIPITYVGLRLSEIKPILTRGSWTEEGTSLLFGALKYLAKGPIPAGHELVLHPTAMAGWGALLITMLNLLPYGPLDGGHVAFAWIGRASGRLARVVLFMLPALALAVGVYEGRAVRLAGRDPWIFGTGYTQGLNWLFFALLMLLLHRADAGVDERAQTDGPLSAGRKVIAAVTLSFTVLLFMPVPLRSVTIP